MVLVDEMIPGPEGYQVSVVGRRGDADTPGASDVGVTQLVRQSLDVVRYEGVVIPQDVIMRGSGGALDASMTAQIEVILCGVCDHRVHRGSRRNVATLAYLLLLVCAEQSRVVSLLNHHKSYSRLIPHFQFNTSLSNCFQLVNQHLIHPMTSDS